MLTSNIFLFYIYIIYYVYRKNWAYIEKRYTSVNIKLGQNNKNHENLLYYCN